jgi:hypothetical protein
MKHLHCDDQAQAMLDALIEEITVDAHGDDETLWAFRQALEDKHRCPARRLRDWRTCLGHQIRLRRE